MLGADKKQPLTTRLGAYEIIRPLAKGGMAELFLVRATGPEGFEKVLVLKRILPHYAENPRFVRAFLDEAKLVAGFDHPHIAHVHDMGTADGSYFFTMEYVHGVDVRTIFRRYRRDRTPLSFEVAVIIARNIASALHYAHERVGPDGKSLDVVHRDVSPSNIIVSYDGVPKLVDFGIAKATSSSMKTQTGALKGKIAYMSPEQAKGAPIDRRTDIYALGIILWELIANRRLYKSENEMATIQRIIHEPAPSPRTHRPDCPAELERIVHRALSLDITKRYQTAAELELDLEELARELRMKQSALVLSAELKRTFALELDLWTRAQAGAATVTDAIANFDDNTTRILIAPSLDDDEDSDFDDDPDDAEGSYTAPSESLQPPTVPRHVVDPSRPLGSAPPSVRRKWMWIAALAAAAFVGTVAAVVSVGTKKIESAPAPAAANEQRPAAADDQRAPAGDQPIEDPTPVEATKPEVAKPVAVEPPASPPPAPAADIEVPIAKTDADAKKSTRKQQTKKAPTKKADAKSKVETKKVEETKPKVEAKAKVDEAKPKVETKSKLEETKPTKAETKPKVEETKPTKAETKPKVEETKPTKVETKPKVEETKPKVEDKPKPKFDPNAVFPPSS